VQAGGRVTDCLSRGRKESFHRFAAGREGGMMVSGTDATEYALARCLMEETRQACKDQVVVVEGFAGVGRLVIGYVRSAYLFGVGKSGMRVFRNEDLLL